MLSRALSWQTLATLVGAAALFGGVGGAGIAYVLRPPAAGLPVPAPVALAVPLPPIAAPPVIGPSFDIVRISPNGDAVMAGRAEPRSQVVVRDGEQPVGETRSDSRGEWVMLPSAPLAPGGRELTLASRDAKGTETKGDSVLLSIPPPASGQVATALVVPDAAAPRVVQGPGAEAPEPRPAAAPQAGPAMPAGKALQLGLNAVDYDDRGSIRFAGTAPPNAPIRLYVDNAPVGDASTDAAGRWMLSPQEAVIAGLHKLRVDQLASSGEVQARVELPFQRSSLSPAELAAGRVVVQPGQNLWRLARSTYGAGTRYTVIYLANRDQIRDPRFIYPGQAFSLPGGKRK